jgi:tRNA pseudouridine38-40 synthase
MQNIKMILSCDGTNYFGSQSQDNGNTIQDKLIGALYKITGERKTIYFAGRTDSGVHAEGQVINFLAEHKNMQAYNWLMALNSLLPQDIRILSCEFVPAAFNARRSAIMREYHYKITNAPVISALSYRYTLHYRYNLDIDRLQDFCNVLVGENNFSSFCSVHDICESKIRYMDSIKVEKDNNQLITIKFIGNAFLHHMIRIIVGTLLSLHQKKAAIEEMLKIIEAKDRNLAGPTSPAQGLVFYKVYYS